MQDKLENVFGAGLKHSDQLITLDPNKKITNNVEQDVEFVRSLREIKQHSSTITKQIFAKRADLTEEEYEFVEKTGEVHYKAHLFNQNSTIQFEKTDPECRCKCGCKKAHGQSLPFCINEEEQAFFGPGIILFFFYAKRIFLLVLTCVLIYGIFSLTTNLISHRSGLDCTNPGALFFLCQWKILAEIQNKQGQEQFIVPQLCLGFVMCVIWIISVKFFRAWGRIKNQEIDDKLDSASDYFIMLEKLPVGEYHEEEVVHYIQNLWNEIEESKGAQLKIKSVQIIYDMSEVRAKITSIYKLAKQLSKCLSKGQVKDGYEIKPKKLNQYVEKKQQIIDTYNQLQQFRQNFLEDTQFRAKLASECALVQFQVPRQMVLLLSHYGSHRRTFYTDTVEKIKYNCLKKQSLLLFKGRNVIMMKAPQPSDIFWQHCEKKNEFRFTLLVWFINLCLNGLSYGALQLVAVLKEANPDAQWLQILSVVLINLFNRVIWNILLNVVLIEENYTKTINIMSVMNKSYASQLINIILIPIILNVFQADNIDGPTGLAGQVHDFQLTSFIFMFVFNMVNIPHRITMLIQCIPCLRRKAIRYHCRITGEFDNYAEMKDALVFLYQPPVVPVAGLYVYITSIIGQAFFFCHLQPILLFYLIINLVFFHLINRYMILRMSKIPDLLDVMIFQTCIKFALNIPCLYGVSSIFFLALRGDAKNFAYYIPSILCLIVWLVSIVNPCNVCQRIVDTLIETFIKKKEGEKTQSRTEEKPQKMTQVYFINDTIVENTQAKSIDPIPGNMNLNQMFGDLADKGTIKRKQNYYGVVGTNELFNFQSKLKEVRGTFHNKNKEFCQQFQVKKANEIVLFPV